MYLFVCLPERSRGHRFKVMTTFLLVHASTPPPLLPTHTLTKYSRKCTFRPKPTTRRAKIRFFLLQKPPCTKNKKIVAKNVFFHSLMLLNNNKDRYVFHRLGLLNGTEKNRVFSAVIIVSVCSCVLVRVCVCVYV